MYSIIVECLVDTDGYPPDPIFKYSTEVFASEEEARERMHWYNTGKNPTKARYISYGMKEVTSESKRLDLFDALQGGKLGPPILPRYPLSRQTKIGT